MRIIECEQRSSEWLIAKCGAISSAHIAAVTTKRKRGTGDLRARIEYKFRIASERLTGRTDENYVTTYMEDGVNNEPLARSAYEVETGNMVDLVGIVVHDKSDWWMCSPDGLVGSDGLIELKCPASKTHLEYFTAGAVPEEYRPQMMWQMACTGRKWNDFVSYDHRYIIPAQRLFICRLERDEAVIAEMEEEVRKFEAEVQDIIKSLPTKKGVSPLEHQLAASLHITERDIRSAL